MTLFRVIILGTFGSVVQLPLVNLCETRLMVDAAEQAMEQG